MLCRSMRALPRRTEPLLPQRTFAGRIVPHLGIPMLPITSVTTRYTAGFRFIAAMTGPNQAMHTWTDLDQPLLRCRSRALPAQPDVTSSLLGCLSAASHTAPDRTRTDHYCLSVTITYTGDYRFTAASPDHPFRVEGLAYQTWPGLGCQCPP
jgi:hypothetical protein